ncbi:invertase inhibitor [Pyrus ussuriensis x Pyrus communis]|uniref:Invertase inhibitor n=1 Tax=Pyrus ussuriensis x Pyrus communis TaxID=2448454 RepID=A0A5N5H1B9_9ROSA|nr:invertase inhibitor [Pyrus ussuriensis x Pyrus communis]
MQTNVFWLQRSFYPNNHRSLCRQCHSNTCAASSGKLPNIDGGVNVDSAAVAFSQKDYDTVENSEIGTPRAQEPPVNPLTERNNQMRILIVMALNAVHELKGTKQHN